jgi:glycolate oxidase FAD binding subunit
MTEFTPTSAAEVAALIEEARRDSRPLWFTGSGTMPISDGHSVVSTRGLKGIVNYRPDDLTVVVRSGMTLEELDDALQERGHTAVLPETSPKRTIGGVVASGASGYRRLRFGPTRDRVIGTTIVTGYGEVVHAGGQLVKNVTGYDIPRLVTGSYGALGFIAEVSLKLWPVQSSRRTVRVDDPGEVGRSVYQPTAVLETETGGFLYTSGESEPENSPSLGFAWPEPLDQRVVVGLNVPARIVPDGIDRVRDLEAVRFVAQHGVGVIDVGWDAVDASQILGLRTWAESEGGSLVIRQRGPLENGVLGWGEVPSAVAIQRRLKTLFDPDGVCNPGVLPGGV